MLMGTSLALRARTLSRGRRSETVAIVKPGPEGAEPDLKQYVTEVQTTRSFFEATPDSPLEALVAEAPRHPVFRIRGGTG
jgi:hypothetical protein